MNAKQRFRQGNAAIFRHFFQGLLARTAGTVLIGMILLIQVSGAVVHFTDVSNSNWARQYIKYLSEKKIISGYPDQSFRPNAPVTRAEFAVMLAKSHGLLVGRKNAREFSDVARSDWASSYIQAVANQGWIAGYPDGRFAPEKNISMAELYVILAKTSGAPLLNKQEIATVLTAYRDAQSIPEWARPAIATLIQAHISVDELSTQYVYPNTPATRASVATALAKSLNEAFRVAKAPKQEHSNATAPAETPSVAMSGQLHPVPGKPEERMLVTPDGKRYYLTLSGDDAKNDAFAPGRRIQLTGKVDAASQQSQHPQLMVESVSQTSERAAEDAPRKEEAEPDKRATPAADKNLNQTKTVDGQLMPTVEGNGWLVQVPETHEKYVLTGLSGEIKGQRWFKKGARVSVTGQLRPNELSIYQEGPLLEVSQIEPHREQTPAKTPTIHLYFPKGEAGHVERSAERQFSDGNPPRQAVEELLKGPNADEQKQGFRRAAGSEALHLQSIAITPDGQATVLLSAAKGFPLGESGAPTRITAQITQTLRQFPEIQRVRIRIQDASQKTLWHTP